MGAADVRATYEAAGWEHVETRGEGDWIAITRDGIVASASMCVSEMMKNASETTKPTVGKWFRIMWMCDQPCGVPMPSGMSLAETPGEAAAQEKLASFLARPGGYADDRDRPDRDGTSSLSPYLRFGEISPRQVWHAARFAAAWPMSAMD